MKLLHVYGSARVWDKVSRFAVKPKIAYLLLKYLKQIQDEYRVIETVRNSIVREIAGAKEGEYVEIRGETEATQYNEKFSAVLDVQSEMKQIDITLGEFIDEMFGSEENKLSALELGAIEPFFLESNSDIKDDEKAED